MAKKSDSADGTPSVMQMVREALEATGMDSKPDALHAFIMEKYSKDVPKQQISTYKSILKNKPGSKKDKKTAKADAPSAAVTTSSKSSSTDVLLQFVSVVRAYEDKLGADKIVEAVHALYKKG